MLILMTWMLVTSKNRQRYSLSYGRDGNDILAIASGNDRDRITDFELGKDRLGLVGDLSYDDLTFSGSRINLGDELLATLTGVDTEQLTSEDFTVI